MAGLARLVSLGQCAVPVYALGGLTPADAAQAWEHGAHGLAMIRGAYRSAAGQ
ncbi:MAG: thiamine phosphate synthase [Burkholderiaceae bacterium]